MRHYQFQKILKELDAGKIANGYFLLGDSYFLKEKFINKLKKNMITELVDFNYNEFWGGEVKDPRDIFDEVIALPMMIPRRLIVIYNADDLKASIKKHFKSFNIPDTTCIVLSAEKPYSYFQRFKTIKLYSPWDSEIGDWVEFIAASYDLQLTGRTAQFFVEKVGKSLANIDGELKKLSISKGKEDRTVRPQDVDTYIAHTRQVTIYQFTDSFGSKEYDKALELAQELQEFGEYPTRLIYWLALRTKQMLLLKILTRRGLDKKQISSMTGIKYFKYQDVNAQADKYSIGELAKIIETLNEVDLSIKQGLMAGDVAITFFFGKVME